MTCRSAMFIYFSKNPSFPSVANALPASDWKMRKKSKNEGTSPRRYRVVEERTGLKESKSPRRTRKQQQSFVVLQGTLKSEHQSTSESGGVVRTKAAASASKPNVRKVAVRNEATPTQNVSLSPQSSSPTSLTVRTSVDDRNDTNDASLSLEDDDNSLCENERGKMNAFREAHTMNGENRYKGRSGNELALHPQPVDAENDPYIYRPESTQVDVVLETLDKFDLYDSISAVASIFPAEEEPKEKDPEVDNCTGPDNGLNQAPKKNNRVYRYVQHALRHQKKRFDDGDSVGCVDRGLCNELLCCSEVPGCIEISDANSIDGRDDLGEIENERARRVKERRNWFESICEGIYSLAADRDDRVSAVDTLRTEFSPGRKVSFASEGQSSKHKQAPDVNAFWYLFHKNHV